MPSRYDELTLYQRFAIGRVAYSRVAGPRTRRRAQSDGAVTLTQLSGRHRLSTDNRPLSAYDGDWRTRRQAAVKHDNTSRTTAKTITINARRRRGAAETFKIMRDPYTNSKTAEIPSNSKTAEISTNSRHGFHRQPTLSPASSYESTNQRPSPDAMRVGCNNICGI